VRPAPLRCLVVDDESLARDALRVLLGREPDFEVVGEAASAGEARRKLEELAPDVLFVDVCLGDSEGFDALGAARPQTLIVFVTAFEHYARRAFDARALDYLLKPFDDERFARTLERVRGRAREQRAHDLVARLADPAAVAGPPPRPGRIALREGDEIVLVAPDEVEWVRADDYYVEVRARGHTFLVRQALRSLEAKLDPHSFVRVHRSALVHIGRVRGVRQAPGGECFVVLLDGTEFRVSRSRQRAVYERLGLD
jgi:two-component system, LytTR family, response regulator